MLKIIVERIFSLVEKPAVIFCVLKRLRLKKVTKEEQPCYAYKGNLYPAHLTGGNAVSWIRDRALFYCKGEGIDIGAGRWPLPGSIPIDKGRTEDAYHLERFKDGSLDFVFSSHCLEHLRWWKTALALWVSKLKVGGLLFLYLPHPKMSLWHPREPWVGFGHKWIPSQQKIVPFLQSIGMRIIEMSEGPDNYWSFYIVARRVTASSFAIRRFYEKERI
jgi:SAM-dependent methyltransferase